MRPKIVGLTFRLAEANIDWGLLVSRLQKTQPPDLLEHVGRLLEHLWATLGKALGVFRIIFGRRVGTLWTSFKNIFGRLGETLGTSLGTSLDDLLEHFGRLLEHLWTTLGNALDVFRNISERLVGTHWTSFWTCVAIDQLPCCDIFEWTFTAVPSERVEGLHLR